MKISKIYDTALYLAEKLDDTTGYIDDEYRSFNKMKALEIIKQAAMSVALIENFSLIDTELLTMEDELMLPFYYCKFVIPLYLGALLCHQDGEEDKYNFLISEYQNLIERVKHDESSCFDSSVLEGLR